MGLRAMLALAPCLILLLAFPVSAQKYSGQITGTVLDQSGAALPDTVISVTQIETGLKREVQTNQDGIYTVPDLPIGTYRISATRSGFKEAFVESVTVNVATTTRQDLNMQVGEIGEKVEIVATDVQVETTTGQLGEVVNGEQVRELPLNGRSFVQLTQLSPGVSPASNFDSKNKGLFAGVDFSVNGNTTQNNLFLTDGANNNDTGSNRTILLYPSIEAIAEFKMLRNSYGPEYGQASGAIISIVTRSGENEFHGSAFYFGRNDKLNARDFFAGTKDKLRRNDFGFSIGGPIVRNRLFFFYSQEWNKEIRGLTRFGSVPTLAERSGDFRNPRILSNGTRCSPDPIGNGRPGAATQVIPQADLNPAGQLLVRLYPEPNLGWSPSSGNCNNWRVSTNAPIDFREENVRIDYKLNNSNHIFGRYTQDHWENPAPLLLGAGTWGDDAFPGVESSWAQPARQAALKLTSTLSGNAVNEVQFSYSANRIDVTAGLGQDLNAEIAAAIPTAFPENLKRYQENRTHPVFWGGLGPYSSGNTGAALWSTGPFANSLDIYSIRDDFTKVTGNHTLKMGFLYEWAAKDEDTLGSATGDVPQFWGACCANNSGNVLADVLTRGSLFGYSEISTQPVAFVRYKNIEFYFGDTWKVRPNLTLELGARWSFLREPVADNDLVTAFDPRFYDPTRPASDPCNGLVSPPGTNPCAGIPGASATHPGVNRALRENDNNAIAPRLGLAWDPWGDGKTAIRMGVGQFFQRERHGPFLGLSSNSPFGLLIGGTRTLDGSVINIDGPPAGAPSRAWDPTGVLPNTWQWNLTVDREIYRGGVLEAAYVGNRAIHQLVVYDINQPVAANRVQAAFLQNANSLRPYSNYGLIINHARQGNANYHALQLLFKTRLWAKSQFQAAYTWSRSLADAPLDDSNGGATPNQLVDTYNRRLEYGNSGINRPHLFVANYIFHLPSLRNQNSLVRAILGGWEFGGIVQIGSGASITPRILNGDVRYRDATGATVTLSGEIPGTDTNQANTRPNRVPGVPCRVDGDKLQIVNPAAFTMVGMRIGQPGNASRGSCPGPGIHNWDMSIYKNFNPSWLRKPLGEGARLQLRLEMFNAFNHAQFKGNILQDNNMNIAGGGVNIFCGSAACSPTNTLITGETKNFNFGRASQTRGPREIQYALKLIF